MLVTTPAYNSMKKLHFSSGDLYKREGKRFQNAEIFREYISLLYILTSTIEFTYYGNVKQYFYGCFQKLKYSLLVKITSIERSRAHVQTRSSARSVSVSAATFFR